MNVTTAPPPSGPIQQGPAGEDWKPGPAEGGAGRAPRGPVIASMEQAVGGTPHLRVEAADAPGASIHVKLEGCNPTGSLKDRSGLRMLQEGIRSGALRPGMTLLDASSGNMACSLCYFGRLLGYPSAFVVNSKLTDDKRNFLRFYGSELTMVGDFTIEGNRWCRERMSRPGSEWYWFVDQLHNWWNPRAHYDGTGPEILEAFPQVELVVASLGTGGTLYGTARYLKEQRPGVKIVAVEAAAGTRVPGTANFHDGDYVTPFIQEGRATGIFDEALAVTEADAVRRTLQLRDQGVFCGLQTGGVFHAAIAAAADLGVRGDVVFISGDAGWKNIDRLLPFADACA